MIASKHFEIIRVFLKIRKENYTIMLRRPIYNVFTNFAIFFFTNDIFISALNC